MFCPQCKKQIPDDSDQCAYCGYKIDHKAQVPTEIRSRRYQRWFFYALIIFIFLGMIGILAKVYKANNDLLSSLIVAQKSIKAKDNELQTTKTNLNNKENELKKSKIQLTEKEQELQDKMDELKKKMNDISKLREINQSKESVLASSTQKQKECIDSLSKANSNIYSLVVNLGIGVSNADINKIPLADANLNGMDTDGDGLSDDIERALGTDINKIDTDGDGYTDKDELLNGYNPLGKGVYDVDTDFINKHKGDILIQANGNNEAWYIGWNGKKYFLGTPVDAFKTMRGVDYWTKPLPKKVK